MKYKYVGECDGNNNDGCFLDSCGHDCGCYIRVIDTDVPLSTYKSLEENGVYIHYVHEHYTDGTNLNFSIEFKNHNTQTGWYNDNHEFGDVYETMVKSVQLAQWYLEDPKRIELINSGWDMDEYRKYVEEMNHFIDSINTNQ